ncbi:hypothetical protein [Spiroplasma attinicola]|uniref:hypothetical protein n=1 Tax=Spiroplasma attinicola TaxID=2904537 RepID=UPI002022B0D5|nr:hypothetical protein [Spiroplasma sp. JKS002670]MCL8209773.1 hypothetical protein [Spiroplasma sp. JKS002670]
MNKEYSVFQIWKNDENKVKAQKIVLKKFWIDLKDKYQKNYKYYDYYLNLATNAIFGIVDFESLLVTSNYEEIWIYFNIEFFNDKFLGALEFFFNIFSKVMAIGWEYIRESYSDEYDRNRYFSIKFKIFQDFLIQLAKFFDWNGYSLSGFNKIDKDLEYNEYHLVKKDTVKVIENINVADDLKTLLLELSQERLEIKDLENYLSTIYNNYLDVEQDQIKQYLGNKIHSDIFNLFNNGLIKHKDSKNISKLSQFTEQEKVNALKWLKDIVLVYFAVSRNGNDYPERIINFKHKNNAN